MIFKSLFAWFQVLFILISLANKFSLEIILESLWFLLIISALLTSNVYSGHSGAMFFCTDRTRTW